MEQLKLLSKKTLLKTSQSLDDIPVLIKEHLKKNKTKSSSLISQKDEVKSNKDCKYEIIATSVVDDDNDEISDSYTNNLEELPNNIKKLTKNDNKQKSEPNLTSKELDSLNNNIIIDKRNIIDNDEKNEDYLTIDPETNIKEIPNKSYINENDATNNTSSKNIRFNTHYKNSSECSNNGKGLGENGDHGRFMEDENNYKDNNNNLDKKKSKENQVNIEEISADKFFEYLKSSNISKINDLNINNNYIYDILIFDFRANTDFMNEYISKSINVNIPGLILSRSLKYQYTNSFNIQKFVSQEDSVIIEKWISNNYKINTNNNLIPVIKPLIIVYDDQNVMDIEISSSPVKTFLKFLEVQHIIALNELNYSLQNEYNNNIDNSQSTSFQENNLIGYLFDKPLDIAWVTGGYDAICSHSESVYYILNNIIDNENNPIVSAVKSTDEQVCSTPLNTMPLLRNPNDNLSDMECSTPLKTKPKLGININNCFSDNECSTPIDNHSINPEIAFKNANNNYNDENVYTKPNIHLEMLNKKKKNNKQKLALNIGCVNNNGSEECKTPLSAIPNSKESLINPNYSSYQKNQVKVNGNFNYASQLVNDNQTRRRAATLSQLADDDKIVRRRPSTLSLKTNNIVNNVPKPVILSNGMLGVEQQEYDSEKKENESNESSSLKAINKNIARIMSPSYDLPQNISPTTSTVIPHYTKVLPYLYIGTETIPASSNAVERLKKLNVTHVLNVAMECNVGVTFPEDQIVYKKIDLADNLAENIAKHLGESCDWIGNFFKFLF